MKKTYLIIAAMTALAMAGCSKPNTYTPAAGASGADIFKAACLECHKIENGKIFELAADKATPAAIAKKITEGGAIMASFPNIKGEELKAVSQYVIENSKVK
ncbi:MAG: cytochrome c [Gallionellaceae bacterium]|nr:cytochrome c [Gallionellaceae bacterium]